MDKPAKATINHYRKYIDSNYLDFSDNVLTSLAVRDQYMRSNLESLGDDFTKLYVNGPEWNLDGSWFFQLDDFEGEILEFCYEKIAELGDLEEEE